MRAFGFAAVLLASLPVAVAAQPATPEARRTIHTALPAPDLSEDSKPSDLLRAAQGALAAGRKGMAEQSLEMAQTRLLDRSVPLGHTQDPSKSPAVEQIAKAREALAAGERTAALQSIQVAIESATAEGL
jgi:hypothetical protein